MQGIERTGNRRNGRTFETVWLREYTDKYTGEGHVIGEKLDMTEERFAEIQDKGMFVVDISDEVVQQENMLGRTSKRQYLKR